MKIANLSLPEWAWVSGGDHEPKDILKGRSVILHVRSATVVEILERDTFIPAEDIPVYEFEYHNRFGATEQLVVALHYSVGIDIDFDSEEEEVLEIMRRAAEWYCSYCDWEDKNIETDDMAMFN